MDDWNKYFQLNRKSEKNRDEPSLLLTKQHVVELWEIPRSDDDFFTQQTDSTIPSTGKYRKTGNIHRHHTT